MPITSGILRISTNPFKHVFLKDWTFEKWNKKKSTFRPEGPLTKPPVDNNYKTLPLALHPSTAIERHGCFGVPRLSAWFAQRRRGHGVYANGECLWVHTLANVSRFTCCRVEDLDGGKEKGRRRGKKEACERRKGGRASALAVQPLHVLLLGWRHARARLQNF